MLCSIVGVWFYTLLLKVILRRLSTALFCLRKCFTLPSQAQHTHDAITEAAQLMKEAVDDIMVTLNEAASEVGLVGGMVDAIAEAMSKVGVGSRALHSLISLTHGPCVLFCKLLSRLIATSLYFS